MSLEPADQGLVAPRIDANPPERTDTADVAFELREAHRLSGVVGASLYSEAADELDRLRAERLRLIEAIVEQRRYNARLLNKNRKVWTERKQHRIQQNNERLWAELTHAKDTIDLLTGLLRANPPAPSSESENPT